MLSRHHRSNFERNVFHDFLMEKVLFLDPKGAFSEGSVGGFCSDLGLKSSNGAISALRKSWGIVCSMYQVAKIPTSG